MMQWIRRLKNADYDTKVFAFNWFIYGIILVATAIYCYARIDFVRSGPKEQLRQEERR